MSDPIDYNPSYSFSGFQSLSPTRPLPAPQVDNELANISYALNTLVEALKDIRRSDGQLQNGSVGVEALSTSLTVGFTLRGTWVAGVEYRVADTVVYGNVFYRCNTAHTSAAGIRPDIDTVTWSAMFDVADISGVMSAATYDPQNILGDAFARSNHTGQQAISTVSNLQTSLDAKAALAHTHAQADVTGLETRLTAIEAAITALGSSGGTIDPWLYYPVGAFVAYDTGEGLTPPPLDKSYRYIDLTAGLTGTGAYNNGALVSETVSGSAPTITATAIVSLSGSPLNGKTINLINTERRFMRSGSAGTLEDSANLSHNHGGATGSGGAQTVSLATVSASGSAAAGYLKTPGFYAPTSATVASIPDHTHTIDSSGSTEARPRNIGVKYYRRIK